MSGIFCRFFGVHVSLTVTLCLVALMMVNGSAWAAVGGPPHIDGGELGLIWALPFAGLLLSIAFVPMISGHFWHAHFGKISAFWAFCFLIPYLILYGLESTVFELFHVFFLEYFPFVVLLFTLYTVAGGVRVIGMLPGTPVANTCFLTFGTALASWTGTTGAAILLIRPFLAANAWRHYKIHLVIFFLFLVANIGGSLTPLGDPPLFLGFLQGVDFFWPTTQLFWPMIVCVGILLPAFYLLDGFFYRRETGTQPERNRAATGQDAPKFSLGGLSLEGWPNILLLLGVVASVLMSGLWKPGISFTIYHVNIELQNVVRDGLLLVIAALSWKLTRIESRQAANFTWFPIVEVAKLFAGIFVTIVPAIAILKAGQDGALSGLISTLSQNGQPVNWIYFWLTGVLSSFLDNAPTYLVFFNAAGGDAEMLMGPLSSTLLAVSAGAVFFGAITYIGNAPNFMVRSIAIEDGVRMPSFFGYMIWSVSILFPLFALVTWLYFL